MPHLTRPRTAMAPGSLVPTTKASAYRHFERWYKPIPIPGSDNVSREFDDPLWEQHKQGDGFRKVWTIVDCDGTLYLLPGFHFVNRINWVLCEVSWHDDENKRGGYTW
jgi:hypothetical protein